MDTVTEQTELSTTSRVFRIVAGSILIGITMNATGHLGFLALLPLLAIYPIATGIVGEDPGPVRGFEYAFIDGVREQAEHAVPSFHALEEFFTRQRAVVRVDVHGIAAI